MKNDLFFRLFFNKKAHYFADKYKKYHDKYMFISHCGKPIIKRDNFFIYSRFMMFLYCL